MEDQEKKSSQQVTKEQLLQKGKDALGSLEEEPQLKSSSKEQSNQKKQFDEFLSNPDSVPRNRPTPTPTPPPPATQQSEGNWLIWVVAIVIIYFLTK